MPDFAARIRRAGGPGRRPFARWIEAEGVVGDAARAQRKAFPELLDHAVGHLDLHGRHHLRRACLQHQQPQRLLGRARLGLLSGLHANVRRCAIRFLGLAVNGVRQPPELRRNVHVMDKEYLRQHPAGMKTPCRACRRRRTERRVCSRFLQQSYRRCAQRTRQRPQKIDEAVPARLARGLLAGRFQEDLRQQRGHVRAARFLDQREHLCAESFFLTALGRVETATQAGQRRERIGAAHFGDGLLDRVQHLKSLYV